MELKVPKTDIRMVFRDYIMVVQVEPLGLEVQLTRKSVFPNYGTCSDM